MKSDLLTAAKSILLAAADLAGAGKTEFTEWDLTVAAWRRDRNRFGLRGYEDKHPDHKRVMSEIMGQTKKDNAVRRGWIEKSGTNRYQITALGLAESDRLTSQSTGDGAARSRSPQHVYDTIEPFVSHRVFLEYCRNADEPRAWHGAAAFLSLGHTTGAALDQKLRTIGSAIRQTLGWMDEEGTDLLQRGPVGGGRTIRRVDVHRLSDFLETLNTRFAPQFAAIRKSSGKT